MNNLIIVKPIEQSNCPIKENCHFYIKDSYDAREIEFYRDYCLKGGVGCKFKKHPNLTSKFREDRKLEGGNK